MTSFDLTNEAWIPVIEGGRRTLVSLRDALAHAHEIDGMALDDPLQAIAIFRQVLLPVVLDACGVPRTEDDWGQRWEARSLDAAVVGEYLETHRQRFDLFSDVAPFAQVAGLHTAKNETKPASLLLPALATGNNVPFFAVRTEADPPALRPAEAAAALLATQCWDTAAIKSGAVGDPRVSGGKTTGNHTGPVGQLGVVWPLGATLAETIHLNTMTIPQGLHGDDRPQWRAEPLTPTWDMRPALGLMDLLTWQCRRIRLVPEQDDSGSVVVREVVVAAGDRLPFTPLNEPHTTWRRVDKPEAGKPPLRPARHQAGRASWQGLAPLVAVGASSASEGTSSVFSTSDLLFKIGALRALEVLPEDYSLQVATIGVVYGSQSAIVDDVIADTIPLPILALSDDTAVHEAVLAVIAEADLLRAAGNRLGDNLRIAVGGEGLPWDKSQRLGDLMGHEFAAVIRRLLSGLQQDPDRVEEAAVAWRSAAREIAVACAEPLLAQCPPTAFVGRIDSKGFAVRESTAEARFQAAVTKILGPPTKSAATSAATGGNGG